jgi:hypothetical protein
VRRHGGAALLRSAVRARPLRQHALMCQPRARGACVVGRTRARERARVLVSCSAAAVLTSSCPSRSAYSLQTAEGGQERVSASCAFFCFLAPDLRTG